MIINSHCRICRSEKLHKVIDLGPQPPANAFLRSDQLNQPEARFPLEVDIVEVRQDPADGIGSETPAVHVLHAAKIAGPGTAPAGFHQLNFGVDDMIAPGQTALITDGQFQRT